MKHDELNNDTMATIKHELDINSSLDNVYYVSQDYSIRYEWDPFSEKIEFLHGASEVQKGTKVSHILLSSTAPISQ